jgi:hydrogenase nickel incorporation protein HypA/HybF
MHEMSIARKLWHEAQRATHESGQGRLARVTVELGPMSGVEPLLLQMALEQLVREEDHGPIELELVEVPLQASCCDCGQVVDVHDFRFVCSLCGSKQLEVCRGDGVHLMSIDLLSSTNDGARPKQDDPGDPARLQSSEEQEVA